MIRRALRLLPEACLTAGFFLALYWAFITFAALIAPGA